MIERNRAEGIDPSTVAFDRAEPKARQDRPKAQTKQEKQAEAQAKSEAKDQARAEKQAEARAKSEAKDLARAEKARAKAQKIGIDVDGALVVAFTYADGAEQFLLVFPDRVEHINRGKPGTFVVKGAGTETIPISRVSSAECRYEGMWCILEVHTSGNSIKFKADQRTGPRLRQTILDLVTRPAPAPTAVAVPKGLEMNNSISRVCRSG